jgi:hypothetical protein
MKFTALLFYAIRRIRRKETLLRSPRVPLEIFTSLSRGMTLRFLGVLFAFSLFLVKMSLRFILTVLFVLDVLVREQRIFIETYESIVLQTR